MKKILFTCVILCLIAYSFFFPEITVNAAKKGLDIWFHQILPALLPFTILSTIVVKSNFLKSFQGNANLIACLMTMSCGFIFGFPIGAKLASDFYRQDLLSKKQATMLSITTNNFSPMYVCGFAIPLLFSSNTYILPTYLLLYLAPLVLVTIYLLLSFPKGIDNHKKSELSKFELNIKVMDEGIIQGFESLIKICGYIVFFSIVTEILTTSLTTFIVSNSLALNLFLGNLEITNGIQLLSLTKMGERSKYISTIQFLSFGGLSGIAQTGSILADAGLSMHKYIIGKALLSLLLTLLSVLYVFIIHHL